jgi:hypothetical protein
VNQQGYAVKLWFRGMSGLGRVKMLGENQVTLLLEKPWSIDMNKDPDLGPFLPLRAWCHDGEARLQAGIETVRLSQRTGLWRSESQVAPLFYEFEGHSFGPRFPSQPKRMAWRGLVFDLDGGEPRFWGWYWDLATPEFSGDPFGPFPRYAFAFRMPAELRAVRIDRSGLQELEEQISKDFPRLVNEDQKTLCAAVRNLFESDGQPVELELCEQQLVFMLEGRVSEPGPTAPVTEVVLSRKNNGVEDRDSQDPLFVRLFCREDS